MTHSEIQEEAQPHRRRRTLVVVLLLIFTLFIVSAAIARTLRTRSQAARHSPADPLVTQVEAGPDFQLAIDQDDDTPLRIINAKVKEASPGTYEKLTGAKSEQPVVVSAPEVMMINTGGKTINRVMLIIQDVSVNKSTGIVMRNLSVGPGTSFKISPINFVKPETVSSTDASGQTTTTAVQPMKSTKYWLPFSDRSQLHVRVGVEFEDGSKWYNRSQREESR